MRKAAPTSFMLAIAAALTAAAIARPVAGAADPGAAADRRFLEQAAREGLAEVKLGELAAGKAEDPRVKTLARAMLDDFRKLNDELRQLATAKGIALPADLDKQEAWDYRALARLCCYEFNRYYVNMMAEYHIKDVRHFRSEAKHTADPDLRRFADASLRVLKDHREKAQTLVPYFGHGRTDGGDAPQ